MHKHDLSKQRPILAQRQSDEKGSRAFLICDDALVLLHHVLREAEGDLMLVVLHHKIWPIIAEDDFGAFGVSNPHIDTPLPAVNEPGDCDPGEWQRGLVHLLCGPPARSLANSASPAIHRRLGITEGAGVVLQLTANTGPQLHLDGRREQSCQELSSRMM